MGVHQGVNGDEDEQGSALGDWYDHAIQEANGEAEDAAGEEGLKEVTMGSTEEVQGQKRKVVILSTALSAPEFLSGDKKHGIGFLVNSKRFNVAVTRAKPLLLLVGNPGILSEDLNWRELIGFAKSKGCYKGCTYEESEDPDLVRLEAKLARLELQVQGKGEGEELVSRITQEQEPAWEGAGV